MSSPDWDTYRDIVDVVLRFGRALDENDWPAYRSCLLETVVADYRDVGLAEVTVESDAWTALVRAAVSPQTTVHFFSNFQVEVDATAASCVFTHQSSHHVATAAGDPVYIVRGRYFTDLRRNSDGHWKLSRIAHRVSFATGNPALTGTPHSDFLEAHHRIYG